MLTVTPKTAGEPQAAAPRSPGSVRGVVCALSEELGALRDLVRARTIVQGLEVNELELSGQRVLAAVSGVGKVQAAHAAAALISQGATAGLFVVGVCGGLARSLGPGTLVHCTRSSQTDFDRREGRAIESDGDLRRAWLSVAPGELAAFLTADRPVMSLARRLALASSHAGPCVADMETAAVAAVAQRAGVPWAALRAVTDRATRAAPVVFKLHFPAQAGRAAETLPGLLERISVGAGDSGGDSGPERARGDTAG